MSQSKKKSLVEQLCNTGSGFILSFFVWAYVVSPLWGIDIKFGGNLGITAIFTVVSIARGYVWRRCFNNYFK